MVTRPALGLAAASARSKMPWIAAVTASTSAAFGCGRSGGGISRALSMCRTLSHTLRSVTTDASSVYLSKDRSAFALPLPWQAKQCCFRNGRTSFW